MRLSEAIRLGAAITPQAFGCYFEPIGGGTCALGSAMIAIGIKDPMKMPWLKSIEGSLSDPACPECGRARYHRPDMKLLIPHLNDFHLWTRERIADWVELQEGITGAEVPVEDAVGNTVKVDG